MANNDEKPPKTAVEYFERGNERYDNGDFDGAIADFSEAIRLKPDDASAWNNRGNAWGHKGEHDKAIADYNESIRLKPDDATAWYNRGRAKERKGEYDDAIADLNEAIRLKPDYMEAWGNRGNAWANKGEYDKALADYDEALRLSPKDETTIHNRAFALALKSSESERGAIAERLEKEYEEKLEQNLQEAFEKIKANTDIFQEGYDKNFLASEEYEARANKLLRWIGGGLIFAFLLIFSFESGFIRIDSFNFWGIEFGSPEIPPPPPNEMSGATQLPTPDNCERREDCCVQVYQNGCPTPEAAPSNGNTLSPLRLLPWLPIATAISAPFFLWWWGLQRRRYETLTLAYGFQRKKIVEERVDIYSRKFPELHKDLLKVYVLHWMEKSPLEVMLAIGGKSKGMGGSSSAATELLREMEKTLINFKDKTGKNGGA